MAAAIASAWLPHRLFAFGFDHHAGQGLGAAVANDDAARVLKLFFGGADGRGHRRNRIQRLLLAHLHIDNHLRENLEIGGELVERFAGAGYEIEHHERREQAVAGGRQVREENVAGLLAAEGRIHAFASLRARSGRPPARATCECRCA